MPIKTSEEMFQEAMQKGREQTVKNTQKSKRIRELREELSKVITKSTFASSESERQSLASKAQGLKRQIEDLEALPE